MATETIYKQEFLIRNLQTRSVTLYPTKAQIIRDINGITLKPGQNLITIEGLTPTVDEHSVKVDGTGAATITDMSVQLVPNTEIYEDIYPSDDEESEKSEEELDSDVEDDSIKPITAEIKKLGIEFAAAKEQMESAAARLAMLEKYGSTLQKDRPASLEQCLQDYNVERSKAFQDHVAATTKMGEINEKVAVLNKKKTRLGKAAAKAKAKAKAELQKKKSKLARKKLEVRQEKQRIKAERARFWPKKVYRVVISLEAPSGATPGSSRRGSIDSVVKVAKPDEKALPSETSSVGDINLSLSYITYSASWSPRYDLSLNTVTNSGILDYCAELKNTTSEIWRDTKVVLSTSQTSYTGLGDTIPIMQPWHVRLIKGYGGNSKNSLSKSSNSNALYSQYEQDHKSKNRNGIPAQIFQPRNELFGLSSDSGYQNNSNSFRDQSNVGFQSQQVQQQQQQHMKRSVMQQQAPGTSMLFAAKLAYSEVPRASSMGTSLFGSANNQTRLHLGETNKAGSNIFGSISQESKADSSVLVAPQGRGGLFGSSVPPAPGASASFGSAAPIVGGYAGSNSAPEEVAIDYSDEEADTMAVADPALLFEESSFSDSGMTTTYDVPTLKTLVPTSTTTKHKIARIDFKSVLFSHVLVPKLKASAFLKAKLRNASKIALLRGPAGLTLDGSFLGQSTVPRCSAGDSFTLPLGVDPTINVSYAKPTVRRSQSGIFSKEDCEVFTRMAIVTNTKHNAAVELQVLDQIPISEDERLRIEIVSPRGLKLGGDKVLAGEGLLPGGGNDNSDTDSVRSAAGKSRMSVYGDNGAKASGSVKEVMRWGSAAASAKKDGEVNWSVKINPLRGCKLVLEYEATYPGGETVQGIN